MPRVSILLTCYNHLPYLPAAWESIQAQTFRDFEVIALDDVSQDETRTWLTQNASQANLVFNKKNLGTYATLNVGLKRATGDFIAILNDDDVWSPEKLQAQLDLFERHPELGLVHTDGHFIDGHGKRLEGSPLGFEFPRTETGNVLLALLYANKIIASAALVRRECFDALGGFNEAYFGSGDWEMWLRIAERWPLGYVDAPLTMYRVHGTNASHKLDRIWRDDEKLRLWIRERYPFYDAMTLDAAQLAKAKSHNEACLGTVLMLNGRTREARTAFKKSLQWDPSRKKSRLRLLATYAVPRSLWRRML